MAENRHQEGCFLHSPLTYKLMASVAWEGALAVVVEASDSPLGTKFVFAL